MQRDKNSPIENARRRRPADLLPPARALVLATLVVSIQFGLIRMARAADPATDGVTFFEAEIRPLLVKHCHECHGDAKEPKGGLLLTSRAAALAGGEAGAAAVAGKSGESLLVEAIRYQGLKMPPTAKLPEADIAKLARWIDMGLPWPDGDGQAAGTPVAREQFSISPQQRQFWSFQPVQPQRLPEVRNSAWPQTPIDRFILATLEAQGLAPNDRADKRTLLRRISYDLIGLPPTPEEIDAFLADDSTTALAALIERLLASAQYGERWGRHWLDVVRYADTAGETADYPVPQAYKYRNWVIGAFNRDLPYDEFLRQQIAGDVLAPAAPPEEYADLVTATGYMAISRRFGFDSENYHHLTIADTLDTLGRSILGLSIGCARCHDHKYDPISMADYYALYGIFASTRYAFPGSEEKKRARDFVPLLPQREAAPLIAAHQAQLTHCEDELKRLEGELAELKKSAPAGEPPPSAEKPASPEASENQAPADFKTRRDQLAVAIRAASAQRDTLAVAAPYETAYGVTEDTPRNAKIQWRGEPTRLGDEVPRRFLEILGGDSLPPDATGSGRKQLAEWLTRPENPLTARVIVNRVWQYHFGRGLVATPSDFGARGRAPSHPELLDYLATWLVDRGWSLKSLHRLILSSSVYQLSSRDDNPAAGQDPNNERWWRFDRRRLEVEELRDSILAVSGELDRAPGGAHPFPPSTTWGFTQHAPFKAVYPTRGRSVYLMTQRIQKHPLLALFDGADPNASTAQRALTTTPAQALFLMNSPTVHEQSEKLAARLLSERLDDAARIRLAHALVAAREPTAAEVDEAREFLEAYRRMLVAEGQASQPATTAAWAAYGRVLLGSNDFLYID